MFAGPAGAAAVAGAGAEALGAEAADAAGAARFAGAADFGAADGLVVVGFFRFAPGCEARGHAGVRALLALVGGGVARLESGRCALCAVQSA